MFSEELKKRTAVAHMDLERKMIPYLKKICSREDYTNLLDFMYGYYEPLEAKLIPFLPEGLENSHAENIKNDLGYLNPNHKQSEKRARDFPVVNSNAAAMGVLYVLEGSTLGGQIITRMLAKQLETDANEGFSFYNPYGEQTADKWKKFRDRLDKTSDDHEREQIIEGANETFKTLNNWISLYDGQNHR